MKTPIFIALAMMLLSTGFTSRTPEQEYTYHLTIISMDGEEQKFDLEITSKSAPSSEPTKIALSNQTTPFERSLESGEHLIIVENLGENESIESKVVGFHGLERRGSASSDDKRTVLKAGPGGRYSAGE